MLKSRNILVTGASSGIGEAICDELLNQGHQVHGIARRPIKKDSPLFSSYSIDLSKTQELLEKLKSFQGLDTIICNVGKGRFGHLEQLSYRDIHDMMSLNFLSHVYLIKALLPALKKQVRSDIIFIGSEAALKGKKQGSIYCASKFALRGFAQSLQEECRTSSVRVSIIQPGMVRTPFYEPLTFSPGDEPSHAILPEDIAQMISMILHLRQETICDEIILSPKNRVIKKKES